MLLWFRRDLRLSDHPALHAALRAADGAGVLGCFILDDALCRPAGPARAAFLAGCLGSLDASMDGHLVLRRGDPAEVVAALAAEVGARRVVVTADAAPYGRRRDDAVAAALASAGGTLERVGTPYAVAPGSVVTDQGSPFRVFTPFRRAWAAAGWPPPSPGPDPRTIRWVDGPSDCSAADLAERCGSARPRWWEDLSAAPPAMLPEPGEAAGRARLEAFVAEGLGGYDGRRDQLGAEGTSRLSPYLRFGCIHPRQVLAALGPGTGRGAEVFRSELAWREFYADVLLHRPDSARRTLQPGLADLAWDRGPAARARFRRWARGETGFPVVDAAMRQLLAEGWVHNRARMIAASFLVKDLHLDWRWGARWFMYRLVDGDLASNQHGWQWTAGTGTDAAPFHRVFNPARQAERFDPDGAYVRRYVPELAEGAILTGYPEPMVDHAAERAEALRRVEVARAAARARAAGEGR